MSKKEFIAIIGSLLLWACASVKQNIPIENIDTWILIPAAPNMPAHLRHHSGNADLSLTIDQAAGFSCYSELDDINIRNLIKTLRALAGQL